MQYSDNEIEKKEQEIDIILEKKDLIHEILISKGYYDYKITNMSRRWLGGGSTLFTVAGDEFSFFLKVKKSNLYVESKLEEEPDFINESCLLHEKNMLKHAGSCMVRVPEVYFYERRDGIDFLALEFIPNEFLEVLTLSSIEECINLWQDLKNNVFLLYENNIVHADLHEYNIRCKNGKIVLIDFEESRFCMQKNTFEESLDYVGYNGQSTLGRFPNYLDEEFTIPYNCLKRLKEVVNRHLAKKLFEYVAECNYDSSNGICLSLDHGKSTLTYQSITNRYFSIVGQRNEYMRSHIIGEIVAWINQKFNINFIDVGSNNGLFCREVSKRFNGKVRCIGLEGFSKFNILARGLAFIENCENVEYLDFICGEDSLKKLNIFGRCIISICSVWHHIKNKERFLEDLKELEIECIILEMAIQDDAYGSSSWRDEIDKIKTALGLRYEIELDSTDDYHRPFIVISKEYIDDSFIKVFKDSNKLLDEKLLGNVDDYTVAEYYMEVYKKERKRKRVVCFGAGKYGNRMLHLLGDENVLFFIDNDDKKNIYEKHMVLSLDEAKEILDDNTIIVITVSERYEKEIRNQLEKEKIFNYMTFEDILQRGLIF